MSAFFLNKKRSICAVLAIVLAISFATVAASMISAAPRDNGSEPLLIPAKDPIRISAPIQTDDTSLLDSAEADESEPEASAPSTVLTHTDNIKVDAPETTPVAETTALEKTPADTAPANTEPVTPDITVTAPGASGNEVLVIPEYKTWLLADDLAVVHTTIKPKYNITEEELILAATIIQLEVMGNGSKLYSFENVSQKYWEMLAVAQCIRNRVDSRIYPNTVEGVILQSHKTPSGRVIYQFSPASDLSGYTPTKEAITAAREVLVYGVTVLPDNYYYFCATRIQDSFEKNNSYVLQINSDGSFDKLQGHLTTFYGGKK